MKEGGKEGRREGRKEGRKEGGTEGRKEERKEARTTFGDFGADGFAVQNLLGAKGRLIHLSNETISWIHRSRRTVIYFGRGWEACVLAFGAIARHLQPVMEEMGCFVNSPVTALGWRILPRLFGQSKLGLLMYAGCVLHRPLEPPNMDIACVGCMRLPTGMLLVSSISHWHLPAGTLLRPHACTSQQGHCYDRVSATCTC